MRELKLKSILAIASLLFVAIPAGAAQNGHRRGPIGRDRGTQRHRSRPG